jgi:hypothetical protein
MRTVLLLLVVGLLIAWYFYRQGLDRPEDRRDRRTTPALKKKSAEYHAVSVKPGAYACAAANNIAGQRFLATEAPDLPLPECSAAECDCHFIHHNDRRTGKDRRSPFTSGGLAAATGTFSGERRKGEDRRLDEDEF